MCDIKGAFPIIELVLDAFATRGLCLVEVVTEQRGKHRFSFDLEGHRLDMLSDDGAPHTFAMDLREALLIDDRAHPGALAATVELINFLHGRLEHVRFVLTDASGEVPRRAADGPEHLDLAPDASALQGQTLLDVRFTALLFEGATEQWREAFELGIDVLLYAVGRMHDELHRAGFPVAVPARSA